MKRIVEVSGNDWWYMGHERGGGVLTPKKPSQFTDFGVVTGFFPGERHPPPSHHTPNSGSRDPIEP